MSWEIAVGLGLPLMGIKGLDGIIEPVKLRD
jgi:hypothetical protein